MDTYILLNEICVEKAICDEVAEVYIIEGNTCECAQNYVDVGEGCVPKTQCSDHEDYISESNSCECSEGYHEEESKCVEDWVSCDENEFLVRDPTTNTCVCKSTHILPFV